MSINLLTHPTPGLTDASHPAGRIVVDLTGLGVSEDDIAAEDLPVAKADLRRISAFAHRAKQAGVAGLTFSSDFHLRSDHRVRPTDDAGYLAARLGPTVPVIVPDAADGHTVTVRDSVSAHRAGRWAKVAIVTCTTTAQAAHLSEEIRTAAAAARRDVEILARVHVAAAPQRERAINRADLVAGITGTAPWKGCGAAIGSVDDVTDTLEEWLAHVDGVVLTPVSVPADVTAMIQAVIPELAHRGEKAREAVAQTDREPAPLRAA